MACLQRTATCVAAGSRPVKGFDYTSYCTRRWKAEEIFLAGIAVRPTAGNKRGRGYEFVAGANGQTGVAEPKWVVPPGAAGDTPVDGSIQWSRQAIGNASLTKTITASAWVSSDPVNLPIEAPSILNTNGEQKTQAFINANATPPGIYVVRNEVTFSDGSEDHAIYDVEVE